MKGKFMKKISAEKFDEIFDEGQEDILQYADLSQATRPNQMKNLNVALPTWMVEELDSKAVHLGISRQAVIKVMLANGLEEYN